MDFVVVWVLVLLFFWWLRCSRGSLGIDPLIFGSGKSVDPRGEFFSSVVRVLCSLVAHGGGENRWILWVISC